MAGRSDNIFTNRDLMRVRLPLLTSRPSTSVALGYFKSGTFSTGPTALMITWCSYDSARLFSQHTPMIRKGLSTRCSIDGLPRQGALLRTRTPCNKDKRWPCWPECHKNHREVEDLARQSNPWLRAAVYFCRGVSSGGADFRPVISRR